MKKRSFASLLVGSAVIGASLAPLSAQAVTTGSTPVQVEFGGGALPDGDGVTNTVRPDPNITNSDFDLLYIPINVSFDKTTISSDLSSIKSSSYASYRIGDLKGTKEGWHITATILGMTNGGGKLAGVISLNQAGYVLYYDEVDNSFKVSGTNSNSPVAPEFPVTSSITIDSGAILVRDAASRKDQGLWNSYMVSQRLSITTPYQRLRAGAYTGSITRNLVTGPST